MKKIVILISITLLALTLSGCEGSTYQRVVNDNVEYYTQEEVDELIRESISEFEDDEFQDLVDYVLKLEVKLDQQDETLQCDFIQMAVDMQVAFNDGYSIERNVTTNIISELRNGAYTGDTFDNQYFIDTYCTVESEE